MEEDRGEARRYRHHHCHHQHHQHHQHQQQHRDIRILDISNHLHTLIRVGYASATSPQPPLTTATTNKSTPKTRKGNGSVSRKRIFSRRSAMNEETIWRRWRAKMRDHCDDEEEHVGAVSSVSRRCDFPEAHETGDRREAVDYSYGELQLPLSNAMRNRHVKHTSSNINVLSYNGIYNGVMMTQHTPPMHNDSTRSKFNDGPIALKTDMHDTFKDYCAHCTIHGLKYVGDTSLPSIERIFWVLSFLLAIVGAAYFIWMLYAKFSMSPIIISRSSETVSIDQFPFPALTVCNMNNAKKSVANKIKNGNNKLQAFFLDDICNYKTDTIYDQNELKEESGEWENIYQFLLNVSQDCSQMLYYCEWHGNTTNCSSIFNPVLTDEGLCCKFNSVPRVLYDPRVWENLDISYASEKHVDWNPEYKFTSDDPPTAIPWRAYGSGSNYGLTLALDVDADEYYCSSTASVGFKMLLHSPVETPQIADFAFTLSPGKETRVIITPHITDADTSIMKISPKVRRCYFLSEKKLRYYRTYTQRNCVLECEANFTLDYCNCMQYYMPVSNNTRICGKNDDNCTFIAKRILKNILYEEDDSIAALNVKRLPSCKCYPGCNEINYSTEISQSMLMATFDIPDEYFKHNKTYFERNIAVVHIFFIDSSYMKYVKNELYGFAELLSNTGGLLGLFMGFSLLSVTEIFYYFTIRLWWRICKNRIVKDKNKFIVQAFTKRHDAVYPFAQ